ncbi:MAG: BolA family transcriptional regulator [Myxococcota bacterium]|jgi:stress-induced morphogen|nr:BolA family transcriptional regulator [Myxococcota bacterium]
MISADELRQRLESTFPGAEISISDLTGGSDHFDVKVISEDFAGKSLIQRHRMVYAPLQDVMGGALHALALTTKTPAEYAA